MKILLISGSLRRGSFNTRLASLAAEALHGKAETELLDLHPLQHLNLDASYPFDPAAEAARQKIKEADGLWFFSPEYNGSYTGPLKNIIDIASLPYLANDYSSGSPLKDKPCAQSGAAGKSGSRFSQEKLTELLQRCGCRVMTNDIVMVSLPSSAFSTGNWDPDQKVREEIAQEAEDFLMFIQQESAV